MTAPPSPPPAPPTLPARHLRPPRAPLGANAIVAVVAVIAVLLAGVALLSTRGSVSGLRTTVHSQQQSLTTLNSELAQAQTDLQALRTSLGQTNAGSIDTRALAPRVLKSVFTIETPFALGTAFAVRRSANGGTILVTNYHVVRDQWESGGRSVKLKLGTRSITGKINTVRPNDDLASVEVIAELPLLALTKALPAVGAPVMVVGSPLGLGGTVTTGVVSAHRKDALQISAPISPGNSGGPVVDRTGHVVGVASAKIVSNHAEGLGFAIPVSTVCAVLLQC
jgi:S1-C subfamily serine protease